MLSLSSSRISLAREVFQLLLEEGMLQKTLATSLMNMVGFRNVAVYDDQSLDIDILKAIIEKHVADFLLFTKIIIQL